MWRQKLFGEDNFGEDIIFDMQLELPDTNIISYFMALTLKLHPFNSPSATVLIPIVPFVPATNPLCAMLI